MSALDDKTFAWLTEILADAETCARLTPWEDEFVADMQARVLVHKEDIRLSDNQMAVLRRIEEKVYSI